MVGSNKELSEALSKGTIDFAFMDAHFDDLPFQYDVLGKEYLKLWSKESLLDEDFDNVSKQKFVITKRGHPLLSQWFNENFNKMPKEINVAASSMDSSIRLYGKSRDGGYPIN